jgi:hypothetical protein
LSRSHRRREARKAGGQAPQSPALFGRREVIGVGVLAAGVAGIIGGIALFGAGSSEETPPVPTDAPVFSPSTPDEAAIEALARRSIEVLPRGEWPSLYDDFTADFQARCPRDQFEQGGEANAAEQGTNLQLLGYKHLEEVALTGEAATAIIVGELRGITEYRVRAAFQRVGETWKLAPVDGTSACEAFTRLEG